MGRTREILLRSSIFTLFMIALTSKQEFLVSANATTTAATWVGSKYQIECTMCSACDNPCSTPSPPPPSPPPPSSSSSSSNCPPPPSPPSSGSNYYSPPPPSPSQSGYPYSSPPPPSGIIGSYYPPPYRTYPSGPTPPPPNPIVPYFPFYYYSPPPPSKSAAALNLRISVSFFVTVCFSVLIAV
ncbi:uncharacterized protein [Coffea arabica]|uniref:Uncharacterized protein n=1 Tax=Coffea arabica TaxID=13443 RepID=A0A6P6WKG8_COFAR|nr:leucine-rich repeat extensin-like protein 1 [Coffea arabica]